MKPLVRCKLCGYVMEEGKLGDRCPACGVPRKNYEPFELNLSEKRWKWLRLDAHPIMVHFPIAIITILFALSVIRLFTSGSFLAMVAMVSSFLAFVLPFVIAGSALAGFLDASNRYKKVKTPVVMTKIALGVTFLLLSVLLMLASQGWTGADPQSPVLWLALTAGGFGLAFFLGKLGSSIRAPIMRDRPLSLQRP